MWQIENLSEGQLHDISQKMLTVGVDYLGSIVYQADIKPSAQDLVPAISRDPKENLSECIRDILSPILN